MINCLMLPTKYIIHFKSYFKVKSELNTFTLSYYFVFDAGERPYRCHVESCGRAFIQLSNLQQHLRNHDAQLERSKNRPFHCGTCGKGFATESSLRTHTSKVCKEVRITRSYLFLIT